MPADARDVRARLTEAIRWRDCLPMLGINPWSYRRRDWPRYAAALYALDSPEAMILWTDPHTGALTTMRVITAVEQPADGHPDAWLRFSVSLPPRSGRGTLIHRPALREAGRQFIGVSRPAYASFAGLQS